MTNEQILSLIVTVILVVIVLKVCKKVLKMVLVIAIIVGGLITCDIIKPEQLPDVKAFVQENADKLDELNKLSSLTDSVQVIKSGNSIEDIKVKAGDSWISISSIGKIIEIKDGVCSFSVGGNTYQIEDENAVKIIELLYNSQFTVSGVQRLTDAIGR